jgi:glycerol-3-phosphate dehydrogenase
LTLADVTLVHHGVVPAAVRGGRVALEGHEQVRDHAVDGLDGIVSVAGTKFTTARAVAERITNTLLSKLERAPVPCRTDATPLPGGDVRDVGLAIADARREFDEGLPTDTIPHLIAAYGSRYRDVMDLAANRPDWRTRIARDSPVIGAELILAARKEMAPTLADIVIRRTPLGVLGYPGDIAVERAATIAGAELRWSDERTREEIALVRQFYARSVLQT